MNWSEDSSDKKVKIVRYRMKEMYFYLNNDTSETNRIIINGSMLVNMELSKPFNTYFLPYWEVMITNIPSSDIRKMRAANTEIRCYVNFEKAYDKFNIQDASKTSNDELQWETCIEGNFYVMMDNNSPTTNKATVEEIEKSGKKEGEYEETDTATIQFALYNEDYLFGIANTVNKVMQNVVPIAAIAWICRNACLTNVLCSPATNMTPIEQLIIPPYHAGKALDWVCNNYSMYDCGGLVFFDLDRGYIINKDPETCVWASGERYDVQLENLDTKDNNSNTMIEACYIGQDDNAYHIIIPANFLTFKNSAMVSSQINGSSMKIIDAQTGEISTYTSGTKITENAQNETVFTNSYGSVSGDAMVKRMKEASKTVSGTFHNVDIDAFKPNHKFTMTFVDADHEDYSGVYRLLGANCIFDKDGDVFAVKVNAAFAGEFK